MVSAILWILIGMYEPNTGVATLLDPFYDQHPDASRLAMFLGVILISVLALILFKRWFSPEYEGSMNTKGLAYGFRIILPIVVFIAVYKAFKVAVGHSFCLSLRRGLRRDLYPFRQYLALHLSSLII